METTEQIIQRLVRLKASDAPRKLVAIAGTPGSGKTTLAHALADKIANCACLSRMASTSKDDANPVELPTTYIGVWSGRPAIALMSSAFVMSVHIDFDVLVALAHDP